jgi:beta-glucosidase
MKLNLFQNNIADLKDYPKFGSQEFIDIIMLQQIDY